MTSSKPSTGSRLALSVGLAALFGGLWLILDALGVAVPPFKDLWPSLLLLAAAAALVDLFFLSRRPSSAGVAVCWAGFGILAFALTLNYTGWTKILDWLPSVPMILGLAVLATWLVDGRRSDNQLIAGGILLFLGVLGFGARFDWLQRILPSAQVLWAGLLLAGGAFLVYRTVSASRK